MMDKPYQPIDNGRGEPLPPTHGSNARPPISKRVVVVSGDYPCLTCNNTGIRCVDCDKRGYSERLTQWTPNGASLNLGEPKSQAEAAEILKRQFRKACEKLAFFEDAIETGRIVDTTPYVDVVKSEIPFKYKVIKPTVHRRNVEMCADMEQALAVIAKLTEGKKK